jgi:hypothetical protein
MFLQRDDDGVLDVLYRFPEGMSRGKGIQEDEPPLDGPGA